MAEFDLGLAVTMLGLLYFLLITPVKAAHYNGQYCSSPDSWRPDPDKPTAYGGCEVNGVSGSCTCLCQPGWIGSQYTMMQKNLDNGLWYYDDVSFFKHCTHRIRDGWCSNHGDDLRSFDDPPGQYRDWELLNLRCKCDLGYVGMLSESPWLTNDDRTDEVRLNHHCMYNIEQDICSGHGTWPGILTTRLNSDQLSQVTCVCDPRYQTVAVPGASNPKRFQCNQLKPCPKINGITCGVHGTCGVNQPACTCNTGYGGIYCCPRSPQTLNGAVCGGRGTCGSTGNCVCNAGFGGTFCCPRKAGQAKECGQYGTCQSNGQCSCQDGWGGNACHINIQCPTNDLVTPKSCSGSGFCTPQWGAHNLIERLNFVNEAHQSITISGHAFADEGAVNLIREFQRMFLFKNAAQSDNYVATHQPQANSCTILTNRTACFKNLLETHFAPQVAPPNFAGGYTNGQLYAAKVVQTAFPWIEDLNLPYITHAGQLLATTGTTAPARAARAQGIALLMAYELLRVPVTGHITAPTFPESFCNCSFPVATPTIGVTRVRSGVDCGSSCLVGNDRQACSGFKHGILRGVCDQASSTCKCGPRFTGKACQTSLAGLCFPNDPNVIDACTLPSHGLCKPYTDQLTTLSSYKCFCAGNWIGQYCEYSKCNPVILSDSDRRVECSNKGLCQKSGACTCDVEGQLSLSDTLGDPPVLPVGQYCQLDGIVQCGTPISIGGGKYQWRECSGRGKCSVPLANQLAVPVCQCDAGSFGPQCEFTNCTDACTGNTQCDVNTGQCVCKELWSSPEGCSSITDGDCFCSLHSCVHGEPAYINNTIAFCECDDHFSVDTNGKCTKLRCPLVVLTDQGERACTADDGLCPSLINNAQTRTVSKDTGCCYDACGTSCRYNSTARSVSCLCSPALAFTQSGGICHSKCHGQPFAIQGNHLICDCSALTDTLKDGQFIVPSTCEIKTCENEGVPDGVGGCVCPITWHGPFCEDSSCGERGVFNDLTNRCVCQAPFAPIQLGNLLCTGDTCLTGEPILVNASDPIAPYRCNCPNDTLIGPDQLSCIALDCDNNEDQQDACEACRNGGLPIVINHEIGCDCTGTGFIGDTCEIIECFRFGTPFANQTGCDCKFPFEGTRCEQEDCGDGVPSNFDPDENEDVTCICDPGFEGERCHNFTGDFGSSTAGQFIPTFAPLNESSSSSTAASVSSTGAEESSTAAAVVTTPSSGLTTAQKIGIGVGAGAGAVIIIGGLLAANSAATGASAAGFTAVSQVEMTTAATTTAFTAHRTRFTGKRPNHFTTLPQ